MPYRYRSCRLAPRPCVLGLVYTGMRSLLAGVVSLLLATALAQGEGPQCADTCHEVACDQMGIRYGEKTVRLLYRPVSLEGLEIHASPNMFLA